jgi:hypothetical protein
MTVNEIFAVDAKKIESLSEQLSDFYTNACSVIREMKDDSWLNRGCLPMSDYNLYVSILYGDGADDDQTERLALLLESKKDIIDADGNPAGPIEINLYELFHKYIHSEMIDSNELESLIKVLSRLLALAATRRANTD